MSDTKHIQLFNRDGTSQQQRRPVEIDPLYAKIDSRQLKDLLSFLWRMAEHVHYYDLHNSTNGHWQDFIGVERAVMLSLIAAEDTAPMHHEYLKRQSEISETNEKNAYLPLFNLFRDHFVEFKELYDNTRRILGKELFLSQRNTRLLTSCIQKLLNLYLGYKGYQADTSDDYIKQFKSIREDMELEDKTPEPLDSLRNMSPDQLDAKMSYDLYDLHQDLQKLFETIIGHAGTMLDETLKRQGDFQPHIGLILTFLRLFEHYQNQLNNLTAKHLKFYYQDVLKIQYREKIADRVFVIIQLAKHVDTCRLEQGTAFKAGKDSEGKNLFYEAAQEFVANKAQVADLKSVYRYSDNPADDGTEQKIADSGIVFKSVKAAIKANSNNGVDEELDKDNPQFPPFGDRNVEKYAKLGFALASPVLRLSGGQRTVTILLDIKNEGLIESITVKEALHNLNTDTNVNLDDLFEIHLSCEKDWEEISSTSGKAKEFNVDFENIDPVEDTSNPQIKIDFTLDSSFPAVVDFNGDIHADQFPEKWPVCKVVLKNDEDEDEKKSKNYYELCRHLSIVHCKVTVVVSGLKNLVLQNDFGLQKPEKPIMLFGNAPKPNAAFYIGSQEVFSKKLESLKVKWEWIDYMNYTTLDNWFQHYTYPSPETSFPHIKISFKRLVDNEWYKFLDTDKNEQKNDMFLDDSSASKHDSPTFELLTSELAKMSFDDSIVNKEEHITTDKNKFKEIDSFKKYTLDLQDGFIKINLIDNKFLFGHKDYSKTLMDANVPDPPNPINPPITPMIQNVELGYTSSVGTTGEEDLDFFHLHPFGISSEGNPNEAPKTRLVCNLGDEGYFFIGLKDLKPPQNISLLFQFVEGTGDLMVEMPKQVNWTYLAEHGWQEFDERSVLSDGTRDLSGTGIISFSIPTEAVDNSTVMPTGYHWIRASVSDGSRAVNMLASVRAQAMELEFADQGNAADHYEAALPAESISKLLQSRAEVKAVAQPFASFGGRPRESRDTYFVRVSERLRHKDRAVTLWDYERLVLENFPQIHKVKCLNHTSDDCDIAPGHVKVVVIPNLTNLNAVNILKPAVSRSLRNQIAGFLKERCSTFVKVRVDNPRYEELTVTAEVTFHTGYDEGYYRRQLSEDIKDFLTPWKKNAEEIHFYETLHSSVILNFIEERPYVNYLTRFKVDKNVEGTEETSVVLGDIVRSHADSLFVSADEHLINKNK